VGGWVATEPFDHTSALRFLEKLTGVEQPNISDWRRSTFGDLTSALRFASATPLAPTLPDDTAEQLQQAQEEVATLPGPTLPGAEQTFPYQEPGRRSHR
jgi:phospholipase C